MLVKTNQIAAMEIKRDLDTLRHSCSHIMAQAVKELWPDTKLGIGPAIEEGFYYDFDTSTALSAGKKEPFTPEDLEKIEKRMREIINKNLPFIREELAKDKAQEFFAGRKENYKVELINELPDERVSIYKTGSTFIDLCKGPHLNSSGEIKAFKLLSIAGAYWRGSEKNAMLQRIYGTAFFSQKELDDYLILLEEIKKRDHRKLGADLEYFSIEGEMGPGLAFWHPKAGLLRKIIEDFWKNEHLRRGYGLVNTPHIGRAELWKTSGHLEFYKDYMFPLMKIENQEYVLKPMNCPGHILIYKSKTRSYRELPLKLAELGTVYRYERSGVLHGLLRVRGFTQDDAHVFCRPNQLEEEIQKVLDLTFTFLNKFGFSQCEVYVSTKPEKHVGGDAHWASATEALKGSLDKKGIIWQEDPGEGVFYGPKIDIKIKDALGRAWQCTTIQVDFNLPERFDIAYIDEDGGQKQPVMIHRAIFGSLERFLGVLLEHYAGDLPLWLAPTQVVIIPIKDSCLDYAGRVKEKLLDSGLRAELDERRSTLDKKIREAELQKTPYILIIGEREVKADKVSVRKRLKGDLGVMAIEGFIKSIKEGDGK
ncbi:MAG: threonine--tRNA ligase [Candidatus Omnitrophota bacterium]|nr:threonine--tRNA ligase [Candidatus Omnitrophota bacterium]